MTADDWKYTLSDDPGFREFQAAKLLKCSTRTIMRRAAVGEFPKPDYYEKWGKRKIPFWYLSTLKAYQQSRKIAA